MILIMIDLLKLSFLALARKWDSIRQQQQQQQQHFICFFCVMVTRRVLSPLKLKV